MIFQSVFGINRYFTWVDPQSKLRLRISLETYDLLREGIDGGWRNEGQISIDPQILSRLPSDVKNHTFIFDKGNKIRFTIDGTGQVFEYFPLKKTLLRVDQTFHSGYNFNSIQFLRNGINYSIGGVGFWNYHSTITYFDEKIKEWEILRPKNAGPSSIFGGFQGYDSVNDLYYSGASRSISYLEKDEENINSNFYQFDFKSNTWLLLGKINTAIPYEKSNEIVWTGRLFLHFVNSEIFIIDPSENQVFLFKGNHRDYGDGVLSYADQDTLVVFKSNNGGPIMKLSISEILSKSEYFGKFYELGIQIYWFIIALVLLVLFIIVLKWKPVDLPYSNDLLFNDLEIKLLKKFIELEPNVYLTTHDINLILGTHDKSQENQRKIRFNIINQLNHKLKTKYSYDCPIVRKPLPEDRRLSIYTLDSELAKKLKGHF